MKMKRKWIIGLPIIIAILVFVGLYYYFNREDENSFNVSDKKWIEEHLSTVIDFNIIDDYPVFGESGVFRKFINDFSEDTGFEFNVIPYSKEKSTTSKGYRFRLLNNQAPLEANDILLQEDVYVLYGPTAGRVDSLKEIGAKTVGVLTSDSDEIIYYLKSYGDIKYKNYDDPNLLFTEYETSLVDMIIVPNTMYLDRTLLNEKYNINYVFTELSKKIILTLADDENNERMNTIVRKYFNSWKENKYNTNYNKILLDYYVQKAGINDKDKTEF